MATSSPSAVSSHGVRGGSAVSPASPIPPTKVSRVDEGIPSPVHVAVAIRFLKVQLLPAVKLALYVPHGQCRFFEQGVKLGRIEGARKVSTGSRAR